MTHDHKLDPDIDGAAPLTRAQRNATLLLPAFLIMAALNVWDGLNGPAELPWVVWASLGLAVLLGGAFAVSWSSAGEKPDEREILIELKAGRIGYFVLIVGNILLLPLAASRIGNAVGALVYFSWAVYSGSILFYSRRSA